MDQLEADFNEMIGKVPDEHGDLPVDYVYFDKGSKWPNRPQGARTWTVGFGTAAYFGESFATTFSRQFTILKYDFTLANIDPSPMFPVSGEAIEPFWLLMLWHEWHHVVNADPSGDFGYGSDPPVSIPVPEDACDHLKLILMTSTRACSTVCELINSEVIPGDYCKEIAFLCNYFSIQEKGLNENPPGPFHRAATNCPDVNPIPGSDPPVYIQPCACCIGYGHDFLCSESGGFGGEEFVNHSLVPANE